MAAILGDLLEFTVRSVQSGEDIYNMYYYRVTSVTGFTDDGYQPLLDEFRDSVLHVVSNIQSNRLEYRETTLKNLSNGVDFVTEVYDIGDFTGDRDFDPLPSFVTYTFRLRRESLATRNGYKRFAGVCEDAVSGNAYVGSSTLTANIATALASDLVLGVVTIAEPVIVRRPIVIPMGTSYVYASIGSAEFQRVGTQNTRKPGSGS